MSETDVINDREIRLARAAEICRERGAYARVLVKNQLGIGLTEAEELIAELKAQNLLGKTGDDDVVESEPDTGREIKPVAVLKEVALAEITPSPLNARRMAKTSPQKLAELVASIDESGLGTPIMVWATPRLDHGYEIVYGERRFQAVSQLGWETIPAIVRHFDSEEEAHEMRLIENMQREDLPPLEEAEGLGVFLAKGISVEDVAKKIGKAKSYVYSRMNIAKLSPRWMAELDNPESDYAKFSAYITWLEEIARLEHDSQDWLLEKGELRHAQTKLRVRELVREQLMVIADAPWDQAWEKYQPEDRTCATCPHRSDAVNLFQEPEQDEKARCCRPTCWESKLEEWLTSLVEGALAVADGRTVGFYSGYGYLNRERLPKGIHETTSDWQVFSGYKFSPSREEAVGKDESGEWEVEPCVLLNLYDREKDRIMEGFVQMQFIRSESGEKKAEPVDHFTAVRPALEKLAEVVGALDEEDIAVLPVPSLEHLVYLLAGFGNLHGDYFDPDEEPVLAKQREMWSELVGDISNRLDFCQSPSPQTVEGLQRLCGWLELPDGQVNEITALVGIQED